MYPGVSRGMRINIVVHSGVAPLRPQNFRATLSGLPPFNPLLLCAYLSPVFSTWLSVVVAAALL